MRLDASSVSSIYIAGHWVILWNFKKSIYLGFPSHSEKSKVSSKNVAPVKSEGRQYVSPAQQPQDMVGNQQAYGQYPSDYGTAPTQYGQQQNDQQPQQTTGQQMASTPTNKGHTGILYSHRPVPDHDSKCVLNTDSKYSDSVYHACILPV